MTQSPQPQDDEALLPCPFCGSDAKVAVPTKDDGFAIHVRCRCGANLWGERHHFSSEEAAIAAWNRRAPAAKPDDEALVMTMQPPDKELAEARELLAAELDAVGFRSMASEVRDPAGDNTLGRSMVRALCAALRTARHATPASASEAEEPMTADLLPCPFCGKSNQDRWPCEWLDGSGANVIRCAWCHGAAPMDVWNRRHPAPASGEPAYDRETAMEVAMRAAQAERDRLQVTPLIPDDILSEILFEVLTALRAADNRDAAGVRTVKRDDNELPGMWERSDFEGGWADSQVASGEGQQAYSIDLDPDGIRARTAEAILGALAFGAQGTNPAPAGHWLEQFWEIGRAEAEQQRAGVPDGWALVPVEPTEAMARVFRADIGSATQFTHTTVQCADFASRYRAMIAASEASGD